MKEKNKATEGVALLWKELKELKELKKLKGVRGR